MVKINKAWLGLLLCISFPLQAEDLLTVYRLSLINDPTYLASEAEMRANNEVLPQAFSKFLPSAQVNLNTTANEYDLIPGATHYNTHGYTINLAQPVFHAEFFSQFKQASYQKQVGILTYGLQRQQLILRSAKAYFDILASLDDLQFTESQRIAFSKELEQAQQRFEVGLIAITEVHEAKAKRDSAIAQEVAAQNAVANNKERLIEIIGVDFQGVAPLKKTIALKKPIPENKDLWVQAALKNNLALQIAQKNAFIARYDVFNARAGHLPYVDIQATRDKSKLPPGSSFIPDKEVFTRDSIGLNFTVPLFQGGAVVSKTRQAVAKFDQANHEVDLQIRQRTSETLQAYRTINSSISEIHALAQAVISNKSALDATRAAYEVGTRTILDVLTAETSLLNAERDYAKARYLYVLEGLNLKAEAGSLNDDDVIQVNELLIQDMKNWPEQYMPANYIIK